MFVCFFSVLEQAETLKNVEVLGKKRDCVERTRKQQFYVRIKCGKSGMSYEQIDAKVMPPVLSMSPMLALRNAVLFVTLVLLQNGGGRSDDVKTKYASGVQASGTASWHKVVSKFSTKLMGLYKNISE